MKTIKYYLSICLTFILPLVLLACGIENEKTQKFKINDNHDSSILINARALDIDYSKSDNVVYSSAPDTVEKVTITITGDNIPSPIIYDLFKVNGKWMGIIGNIPEGPAFVTAQAFDIDGNIIYESVSQVIVTNGETLDLGLVLEPKIAPSDYHVKAPIIRQINVTSQKIAPNEVIHFEVIAEDPDSTIGLDYMWGPNDPGTFANFTSSQTTWTAPETEGTYQLGITVTDQEYLIDHQTVTIEVNNRYNDGNINIGIGSNDFPVITSIIAEPTSIDKGESTKLTVNAYDPDGDKLFYSWSANCPGEFNDTTIANPTFTASVDAEYGICSLEVQITDNTLTYTGIIDIHISDAPIINLAPDIISMFQSSDAVSPNGYIFLIIKAQDPEGTAISFNWDVDAGSFMNETVLLTEGVYESRIYWKAPETYEGDIIVNVEVSDATGQKVSKDFLPIQFIQ